MKIAFDHQIFTYQSYGGISRYYKILAEKLLEQRQDVNIFAGVHRNNYLKDLPEKVVKGIKLKKYPPKSAYAFQVMNHGISQARMNAWKPDIIHETYYSSLPQLKTTALRVTSVYDMIHELFTKQFSKLNKTSEWKRATFNRVDHILSISESTKRDLIELFGITEDRISVVHLGVDLKTFQVPKKNHLKNQKPYLLYVGERAGYKNFSGFLNAIANSPQLKSEFNLIAFGGGPFSSSEMEQMKHLGFSEAQVYQVSGNDEKLAQLYGQAAAFIYPSLYEGFGLPPLEAMAAGCPVVSSNTSSMPEVVNKAGEYFDPNNVGDMQDAIERVVFSLERQSELIELGYQNIKLFSWQKCSQETLEIYRKITGKL